MKDGNWTGIDKALINLMPRDRPYSIPEAMISLSVDLDNGKEFTINGYSKLWGWSRNKVRKFVTELRTGKGHLADSKGTYKGHLITLKIKGFRGDEDSKRTVKGHLEDSKRDTTIKTKTKTKTKKEQNPVVISSISIQELADGWNEIVATEEGFKKVTKLTDDRKKRIRARLKAHPESDFWNKVLNKIPKVPFLSGKNDRKWRADFDFLIKNDENALKIYEGKYDAEKR